MVYIEEIKKFIQDFKKFGTGKEIVDCFSNGYCYWFAYILQSRFSSGIIYYIQDQNHFVYKYLDRIFDITGDCTVSYDNSQMISWAEYQMKELESTHLNGLINNCILKR